MEVTKNGRVILIIVKKVVRLYASSYFGYNAGICKECKKNAG